MPTRTISTHEAKSRLSELIREARAGTDVVILRNGQPVAKLVPWPPDRPQRTFGVWSGQVSADDDDLVGPDPEVAELFDQSADAAP
jgi:prevent-host-death family protein